MSAISLLDGGDKRIVEIRGELGEELSHKKEFEEKYNLSKSALEQAELHAEQARTLIETFDERVEEFNERARVYETKIGELTEEVQNVTRLIDQNSLRSEDASRKIEEQRVVTETINSKVVNLENDLNQSMIVVEGANVKASNRKRELSDLQTKKDEINTRMATAPLKFPPLYLSDTAKQEYMTVTAKLEALREMEAEADASKAAVNKFIDLSKTQLVY